MKKVLFFVFLLTGIINAQQINREISQKFFQKKIPIIDIRTPQEWKQTGILKGAIPIMFFDSKGKYDLKKFLQELRIKVDTSKPFAIICRTGHRTSIIAPFLSEKFGYTVYNLLGGMQRAFKEHLPIEVYKK